MRCKQRKLSLRHRTMYLLVFLELLLGDISTWTEKRHHGNLRRTSHHPGHHEGIRILLRKRVPLPISSTLFELCNPFGGLGVLNDMQCLSHVVSGEKRALSGPLLRCQIKKLRRANLPLSRQRVELVARREAGFRIRRSDKRPCNRWRGSQLLRLRFLSCTHLFATSR